MLRSIQVPRLLVVGLLTLAAACAGQKEPAQKALADLEASFGKVAEQAEKYMPEEFAQVREQLDGLKQSFDAGDYGAVVGGAQKASAAVRKLQADALIAKAEYGKKMAEEWSAFATSMPDVIASVDKQIARLQARKATPKGMDKSAFEELVASFDAAKAKWTAAGEAGNAGKVEEAVLTTREVKQTVDTVMQALGMAAG